jgi:hypothetical protein
MTAGKTEPAHMLKFLVTGYAFIQIPAFPAEKGAPVRKTFFYLKHMVHRNRIVEAVMGVMHAAEYILALILVYKCGFGGEVAVKKAQQIFIHNRPWL